VQVLCYNEWLDSPFELIGYEQKHYIKTAKIQAFLKLNCETAMVYKDQQSLVVRGLMKKFGFLCLLIILCVLLSGCPSNKEKSEPGIAGLRIAILPDESEDKLLERYTPLFEYLSSEIGAPYELIIPQSYSELLELFHEGKLDLAYFGGFTFLKAHFADGAVPLVTRDTDSSSTSYYLVNAGEQVKEISELIGKRLSFGSRLSTSGHLMPRYYLKKKDIVPEDFFSDVIYSGNHEGTAFHVRDGKADLGVANAAVTNRMFKDGRLDKNEVRILGETPAFPDNVWALHPSLDEDMQKKIKKAFLRLSADNNSHSRILSAVDAGRFLPAEVSDFNELAEAINELELLGLAETNVTKQALTLGIHPYMAATELFKRFTPLANYLVRKTGRPVSIRISGDYKGHIDKAGKDKYDMAFMGPASYVNMTAIYGEKPIMARLEVGGSPVFHGIIFTAKGSSIETLADLKNKRFAFGDPNSTMSHLVPRHMLRKAGISVDKLAEYKFLDSHNNVALGVLAGDFDAGAVKEEVFLKYEKKGLKMLAKSPPLSEHIFVASGKLPSSTVEALRTALYHLGDDSNGKAAMAAIKKQTTGLVPANDGDYDNLRFILDGLKRAGILQ